MTKGCNIEIQRPADSEIDQVFTALPRLTAEDMRCLCNTSSKVLHHRVAVDMSSDFPNSTPHRLLHDSTSPINRLPAELLIEIVFNLARPSQSCDHWSFMELMSVCRHWRAIALDTPLLWTRVDNGANIRFLRLALRRARQAPAWITFEYNKSWCRSTLVPCGLRLVPPVTAAFIDTVRAHASHICGLIVTVDHEVKFDDIHFPLLEHLRLATIRESSATPLYLTTVAFPNLHHLDVNQPVHCDQPQFQALSTLQLWNIPANMSLSQLVQILWRFPCLNTLHLNMRDITSPSFWCQRSRTIGPGSFSDEGETTIKVFLPKLQELRLCDTWGHATIRILECLAISVQTKVHIELARESFGHRMTTMQYISRILQLGRDAFPVELRDGRLYIERRGSGWDVAHALFTISSAQDEAWSISLGVDFFDDKLMGDVMCIIGQLFLSMPIVAVDVNFDVEWIVCRIEQWRVALSLFSVVELFSIKARDDHGDFWQALGSSTSHSPGLLLPHLKELRYNVTRWPSKPYENLIPTGILASLEYRNSIEGRLRKLYITWTTEESLTIKERELNAQRELRRFVADVTLDTKVIAQQGISLIRH
ncbi:hypothetical protein OBBRIDRAFT_889540 [Obba rivulosa]|uniref:F-box domain-containing protein n=1 Tax=Obba rivulosa TaxID=1052685 RepID=A0A8E2AT17_9APHY|nr:hypothetical protein OBBRIDRAFT_889540 [Obba rivulosa]